MSFAIANCSAIADRVGRRSHRSRRSSEKTSSSIDSLKLARVAASHRRARQQFNLDRLRL